MEYFLIGLAMSILVAAVLGLIVGYSLLMERLAARRPKSSAPEEPAAPSRVVSRPIGDAAAPSLTDQIGSVIMSRVFGSAGAIEGVADRLHPPIKTGCKALQTGATPSTNSCPRNPLRNPRSPMTRAT